MTQSRLDRLNTSLRTSGLDAVILNPGPTLTHLTGLHFHLMERPVVLMLLVLALMGRGRSWRTALIVLAIGVVVPFGFGIVVLGSPPKVNWFDWIVRTSCPVRSRLYANSSVRSRATYEPVPKSGSQ